MNKPLTINIKKKTNSVEDMYGVYISIIESVSALKFTKQEKIVVIELLKEREITENVKETLFKKIGKARVGNIFTKLRVKGVIKDNKIAPFFQEIKDSSVIFNITLTNG